MVYCAYIVELCGVGCGVLGFIVVYFIPFCVVMYIIVVFFFFLWNFLENSVLTYPLLVCIINL